MPRVLPQITIKLHWLICNTNIDIDTKYKVAIFVRSYSKELFEQNIFQNNYFDYIIDYTDSPTS